MEPSRPWLSVIMPVYQGERYLEHTLASIRNQQDPDIEIVIVDDGSTDQSRAIAGRWAQHLTIRIIAGERSGNWVQSTNRGLAGARGTWISLLHQDDAWLPGRLAHLRALAETFPAAGLLLHPATLVDDAGHSIGRWRCPLPEGRTIDAGTMLPRLVIQNFIPICAPVFRRDLAVATGPLKDDLWYFADWDYWLRLSARTRAAYTATPLATFRIHAESQTATRTRDIADVCRQFDHVTGAAISGEMFPARRRNQALRMQRFAREFYAFMLATAHRQPRPWRTLMASALRAGPCGWWRYVHYARLWDRVVPRLRLRRMWGFS